MTNEETKKLASKIFATIKKSLSDARKYNKEHNYLVNNWNRHRQQADLEVWDNTSWKDGKKVINHYEIRVEGKAIGKCKTHYDVREVFAELRRMLDEQKKVKGWSGLNFMTDRVRLEGYSWDGYEVSIIPKVCLADAPCPEYKSLMNYINKFGVRKYGSPMNLGNYELFSAAKGGKRGYLWDEHGERMFLDNLPKTSAKYLAEIRAARGTKDTMVCEILEEDYIDPEEKRYSEYAEIECEGEHRRYLHITIKTPTGRVKLDTKVY